MIKLAGAIFIAISGVMLGFGRAKELWDKTRLILDVSRALELLSGQVQAMRPLMQSAEALSESLDGRCKEFFLYLREGLGQLNECTVEMIWHDSAHKAFGDALTQRQIQPVYALGAAIASGEGLERAFIQCNTELTRLAGEAEDIAKRDGRMWTGLGLASALALAIVLV